MSLSRNQCHHKRNSNIPPEIGVQDVADAAPADSVPCEVRSRGVNDAIGIGGWGVDNSMEARLWDIDNAVIYGVNVLILSLKSEVDMSTMTLQMKLQRKPFLFMVPEEKHASRITRHNSRFETPDNEFNLTEQAVGSDGLYEWLHLRATTSEIK
jgi:hypothetical protein